MGFLVPSDDYTQKVRVVNTVDVDGSIEVDGGYITAEVDGTVEVGNTVDINISEVNGYNTISYESGLLGVYNRGN